MKIIGTEDVKIIIPFLRDLRILLSKDTNKDK
jgi:hypothetical protein